MKAAWLLACSIASARALAFDARAASKTIKSGGIYVLDDWLEPRLARALRDDALALQEAGAFSKSGVSNTAAAASRYGAQDRAVRTLGPSVGGDVQARAELDGLLEGLRAALSERSPGPLTLYGRLPRQVRVEKGQEKRRAPVSIRRCGSGNPKPRGL